jgi:cAMP-dependent protein kinase regulator
MDPYERSHVADGIKSQTFAPGDYVIREGEKGDIFYMVEEGNLIATKTFVPG